MTSTESRQPRADAQRNRDALLASASRLFAERGPDTTFEEIAADAGVGKGTLYRHFPTRDQLVAAVMQARFDELTLRADELREHPDARVAVETWLREFDQQPIGSRSVGARLGDGLADATSAVSVACQPMKASFSTLVERAQGAGTVRPDLDVPALLTAIASLPTSIRDTEGRSPILEVILRGIRASDDDSAPE